MFYVPELGRFLARDMIRRPGTNLYLYTQDDPVNHVDPLGLQEKSADAAREKLWKQFFDDVKNGNKTAVDAFADFVQSKEVLYKPEILAAGFLPEAQVTGFTRWSADVIWGMRPTPPDFVGFGGAFKYFQDLANAKALPNLGFSQDLAPNEYWNFAHFTGIIALYQKGLIAEARLINQIEEDLNQLATEPEKKAERCAEVGIDLAALQFIMGLRAAMAAGSPKGGRGMSLNQAKLVQQKSVEAFLKEFKLRERLATRKCDCIEEAKELKKILDQLKK